MIQTLYTDTPCDTVRVINKHRNDPDPDKNRNDPDPVTDTVRLINKNRNDPHVWE